MDRRSYQWYIRNYKDWTNIDRVSFPGRIKDLVTEDSVSNSVILLINALYFEGTWRTGFNKTLTKSFFTGPGKKTDKPFMEQTGNFYYFFSKHLNAKMLRLPYIGRRFSMFVILPNEGNDLDRVIDRLDSGAIKNEVWHMDETGKPVFRCSEHRKVSFGLIHRGPRCLAEIQIRFFNKPQWSCQKGKSTKKRCKIKEIFGTKIIVLTLIKLNFFIQLGIRDIFETNATFPLLARGGSTEGKLKVSNIIQKSGIVVDEKGMKESNLLKFYFTITVLGTTAWSATEIELINKFGGEPREFIVDHPFLFYIEDDTTGAKLFSGRVNNPEY